VSENESREEHSGPQERSDPGTGPGETFRARQESSGPIPTPAEDDAQTGIIRRHPTGPIPEPLSDDTRTSIIRRQPSGPIPEAPDDAPTSLAPKIAAESATGVIRQAPRRIGAPTARTPSGGTAMAAATLSILTGWATAVISTDLITAWWRTDRLFCVGVGFLTAVFAASTITGVIQLLLRRRAGIYLTIVSAVLAVMIFAGIFVAGARVSGVVRAMPVLPALAAFLVLLPATWRWTRRG
jgi:hypothetical protein